MASGFSCKNTNNNGTNERNHSGNKQHSHGHQGLSPGLVLHRYAFIHIDDANTCEQAIS